LVDYCINKGVELENRDDFVNDARRVVASFADELNRRLTGEYQRVVNVYYDDMVNLLVKYK